MNISTKISHYYRDFIKTEGSPIKTQEGQLYNNIKIGDLLNAEIIDSMQKQIKILLADGTIFEAKLEELLDIYIGQEVILEVKDIQDNQVILSMHQGENESDIPLERDVDIESILKQLNVKSTDTAKQAVKLLMERTMPITKQSIDNIEYSLNSLEVPIETIIKMLDSEIPLTHFNVSNMQKYQDGMIKLDDDLDMILNAILETNDLEVLDKIYNKLINLKDSQEETLEINEQSDKTLEVNKNNIEINQSHKTGKIKEDILDGKQPDISKPLEQVQAKPLKDLVIIKEEITKVFKELFFMSTSDLNEKANKQLDRINKIYKSAYELVDTIEKLEEKIPTKDNKSIFNEIKSNIEFLNIANKYDSMIQIPIFMQNQKLNSELYIFNKNKRSKKDFKQASMLISLETANLGNIETYVRKNNNIVNCQFKVDSDDIESIIQNNISKLGESLKSKGYDLVSVKYLKKDEMFESGKEEPKEKNITQRYRFDTKI